MGGGLHVLPSTPVIKNMHIGLFGESISPTGVACVSCHLTQRPYFKVNGVKIVDAFLFVLFRLWILAQELHDGVLSISSVLKTG